MNFEEIKKYLADNDGCGENCKFGHTDCPDCEDGEEFAPTECLDHLSAAVAMIEEQRAEIAELKRRLEKLEGN